MRPRVLMFGWEFPPHKSGGLGTACLGLTRAMSKEDVDVTFVLPKKTPIDVDHAKFVFAEEGRDKINIKFKKIDSIIQPYITSNGYIKELDRVSKTTIYGKSLIDEVRRYAQEAKILAQEEDFDIIHAHDWLSFLAGVEAKKISGKPLILHFHATEFDRSGGQGSNPEVYELEKYAMAQADKIVSVSSLTRDILIDKYGADPDKVEVIHNGIEDPEDNNVESMMHELKAEGTKIVLYLGRITIQKGPDYFISAAKKVLEIYEGKVLFVVVGSGDLHQQMVDQAASLGISDKVLFTGWFSGDEVTRIHKTADLFVMPSVSEPFGLVPLESALQGTPAIISKQSGISEVMTNALKVDFWDVDEMTNQIISVLKYGALHKTLTQNALHEAKRLTWEVPAKKCINLYHRVLDSVKK